MEYLPTYRLQGIRILLSDRRGYCVWGMPLPMDDFVSWIRSHDIEVTRM
jgi:hypothetical protein